MTTRSRHRAHLRRPTSINGVCSPAQSASSALDGSECPTPVAYAAAGKTPRSGMQAHPHAPTEGPRLGLAGQDLLLPPRAANTGRLLVSLLRSSSLRAAYWSSALGSGTSGALSN
jgi:hypothetical protein